MSHLAPLMKAWNRKVIFSNPYSVSLCSSSLIRYDCNNGGFKNLVWRFLFYSPPCEVRFCSVHILVNYHSWHYEKFKIHRNHPGILLQGGFLGSSHRDSNSVDHILLIFLVYGADLEEYWSIHRLHFIPKWFSLTLIDHALGFHFCSWFL